MIDEAEEACVQATAGVGGGTGEKNIFVAIFWRNSPRVRRPDRQTTENAICQAHGSIVLSVGGVTCKDPPLPSCVILVGSSSFGSSR